VEEGSCPRHLPDDSRHPGGWRRRRVRTTLAAGTEVEKITVVELKEDLKGATIAKVLICFVVDDVFLIAATLLATNMITGRLEFCTYMRNPRHVLNLSDQGSLQFSATPGASIPR